MKVCTSPNSTSYTRPCGSGPKAWASKMQMIRPEKASFTDQEGHMFLKRKPRSKNERRLHTRRFFDSQQMDLFSSIIESINNTLPFTLSS